jgi:hypothetical protein
VSCPSLGGIERAAPLLGQSDAEIEMMTRDMRN